MRRSETTAQFGQVLKGVFERLDSGRQKKESPLFDCWPKWIGKKAAEHSRPVRVKGGCLLVYVDHPTWLYELNQKKITLMHKIRRELGSGVVTRVHYRLGEI